MSAIIRLRLWPLRVLWVVLALCAAGPGGDALDGRSTSVVVAVTAAAWVGWAGALVAMLVPRTLSLTAIRILVPAGWAAAVAAVAIGDTADALDAVTLTVATAALVFALSPITTDSCVDGSSYGPERRIALRTPLVLSIIAAITWLVMLGGATAGVLLLAAGQWATGAAAAIIGFAVVWFGARSLHQLSKRWLVLVPTGMVLHDPLVMPEPQLFLRQTMARLGPAEVGDVDDPDVTTEDLTAGASGLVMAIDLSEPVELLVREDRKGTTLRPVDRVLFCPALPAELLIEARARRLPVS